MKAQGINFTILIPDVQTLLDNENPPSKIGRIGFDYSRYNRLSPVREKKKSLWLYVISEILIILPF